MQQSPKNETTASQIEIRLNEDGTLDEVVSKVCQFHLEQMSDGCWWMGIYAPNGEKVHVNLFTKRGAQIHGNAQHYD